MTTVSTSTLGHILRPKGIPSTTRVGSYVPEEVVEEEIRQDVLQASAEAVAQTMQAVDEAVQAVVGVERHVALIPEMVARFTQHLRPGVVVENLPTT